MTSSATAPTQTHATGGFTLFEVLIAIAILVLGLISVGKAVNMAFRATAASEAHLKAMNFARMEVERLRQSPFSSADLADGTRTFTKIYSNLNSVVTYSGSISIQSETNANLKRIILQVDWRTPYQQTAPFPAEIQTTFSRAVRI